MISKPITLTLPVPWKGEKFTTSQIGGVNFLVGPNGSGKSKFVEALKPQLSNARLLGTDRLSGMEQNSALRDTFGDTFASGLAKNHFSYLKTAGGRGLGIDTLVLLEERMDLRIQIEATLSQLFNRNILLEWDSGNLVARARLGGTGSRYRLDRDECHGIKELLVMLTHLYNDEHPYLIIDEPELNLHPQYQAFFLQEVRRFAGDPATDKTKKIVFLVTHSPFILDIRTVDDVKSIISFDLNYSVPKQMGDIDAAATARLASLVSRLNVHHKQLFFSDNPVFVEGILDAQLIAAMQEARGASVAGGGSCIIDAGGCEEVNKYLELSLAFGKKAHFLYDLDSLFSGNLRACLRDDGSVQSFLLTAGVGSDFTKYCGELESNLSALIDQLLTNSTLSGCSLRLQEFFRGLGSKSAWDRKAWARARVAMLTAISRCRLDVVAVTSENAVADAQARLAKIVAALREKHIHLLPGGTLERYLPKYSGDYFGLKDEAKRQAVLDEIEEMALPMTEAQLSSRYGALYDAVHNLPSTVRVDIDRVLRDYLGRYIHELQRALINNPQWQITELQAYLVAMQPAATKVFGVEKLDRSKEGEFTAVIGIKSMLGERSRVVRIDHRTNAGMGHFKIEIA